MKQTKQTTPESPVNLVLINRELPKVGDTTTFGGLIATFGATLSTSIKESTRKQYGRNLTQFFVWLQSTNRELATLTDVDIVAYSSDLQKKGLSSLTISGYLTTVKLFYEWAEARKLYPNIARVVKAPRREQLHRKKYIPLDKGEELLELLKGENIRDYCIARLLLLRGLRTIELVRANIEDIDIVPYYDMKERRTKYRRILRIQGKGHIDKDREVDLSDSIYKPIEKYLQTYRKGAKGGEPLFTSTSNNRNRYGSRLTTRTVSYICKEALKSVGITSRSYSAHSFRHSTACYMLQAGKSELDVQGLLGHVSINTTHIYTKDMQADKRLTEAPETVLDNLL